MHLLQHRKISLTIIDMSSSFTELGKNGVLANRIWQQVGCRCYGKNEKTLGFYTPLPNHYRYLIQMSEAYLE